jgi:hypothetical protein
MKCWSDMPSWDYQEFSMATLRSWPNVGSLRDENGGKHCI